MKGLSLHLIVVFSLVVHMTFIATALIVMKQNRFISPSPYIVSLVGNEAGMPGKKSAIEDNTPASMQLPSEDTKQYASDRIAAIEAIRKAKRIIGLRKLISIKSTAPAKTGDEVSLLANGSGEGGIIDSYENKIAGEIRQQYTVIPELKGKNLEAIISVTIIHDGTIKINRIEKSSGNALFDRSVLRAITKASPVSKPPYEMEIGLRFTP